ncbi:MAG: response regulator transcription factor [Spirochaetales bacterium]|nr:response regulator transcription factor [Spirochaetales bacterium]
MKQVLLIDKSDLIHAYLKEKLKPYPISITSAKDGFSGMLAMRKVLPDLMIIDSDLPRINIMELLEAKQDNPNTALIPAILFSPQITQSVLNNASHFNVKEIIQKPLKIDTLFDALSRILAIKLEIDKTPCIIEAHLNEDILFIEIAKGLNRDKIGLLRYKIAELIDFFHLMKIKILLFLHDINEDDIIEEDIILLCETLLKTPGADPAFIKIITPYSGLERMLNDHEKVRGISVNKNLEQALTGLLDLNVREFHPDGKKLIKEDFVINPKIQEKSESNFILTFGQEELEKFKLQFQHYGTLSLAIVDDDEYIRDFINLIFTEVGWNVTSYADGKEFLTDVTSRHYDLVFLDIKMPEIGGFEVIQFLKNHKIKFPIIILSAMSRKNTILKALVLGIKSYIIKPVSIEDLLSRTAIILGSHF